MPIAQLSRPQPVFQVQAGHAVKLGYVVEQVFHRVGMGFSPEHSRRLTSSMSQ
jgi:hypothetical protein